jgi:hypothetical protein
MAENTRDQGAIDSLSSGRQSHSKSRGQSPSTSNRNLGQEEGLKKTYPGKNSRTLTNDDYREDEEIGFNRSGRSSNKK